MLKTLAVLAAVCLLWIPNVHSSSPAASTMGEESFGNKPLSEANYTNWPGLAAVVNSDQRVYQQWVNGNEFCCYQGDMDAINELLKKYSAITCEKHELVLLPGPGTAKSFEGREVSYDMRVNFVGGIAAHMTRLDEHSAKIWKAWPVATIHLSDSIDLDKLVVPENVTVLQLEDLKKDCLSGFESEKVQVRAGACGALAALNPYDEESMLKLHSLLNDEMFVATNALNSLARFGHKVTEKQEVFDSVKGYSNSPEAVLKSYANKTLKAVEAAKAEPEKEAKFNEQVQTIREYCKSRK